MSNKRKRNSQKKRVKEAKKKILENSPPYSLLVLKFSAYLVFLAQGLVVDLLIILLIMPLLLWVSLCISLLDFWESKKFLFKRNFQSFSSLFFWCARWSSVRFKYISSHIRVKRKLVKPRRLQTKDSVKLNKGKI